MLQEEQRARFLLSFAPNVGVKSYLYIIKRYKNCYAFLSNRKYIEDIHLSAKQKDGIDSINDREFLLKQLRYLQTLKVQFVVYGEDTYPSMFYNLFDPPKVLYYKGDFRLTQSARIISIVGTRKSTKYGERNTQKLVKSLVKNGFVVVSGLAFGIDSHAHQSTLDNRGKTIAIQGGSIEKAYPQTNQRLYEQIVSRGCVVSEHFPGTKISSWMFASRNRLVAALSLGVVVIEAGEKSGSIFTATLALEQGINVFALPGDVERQSSIGTNGLIKKGEAKLIQRVDDILEEFEIAPNEQEKVEIRNYTKEEQILFDILRKESLSIDNLVKVSEIPVSKLAGIISEMEIEGKITLSDDQKYCVNF